MSLHHSDFIKIISSISGVISTLLALITTVKAFRFQKETREREDNKKAEEARKVFVLGLENRVMILIDRANNCVDSNAKIKKNTESLLEMTSTINGACAILNFSNLTDLERKKIRFWTDNLLKIAIRNELKTQEVYDSLQGDNIEGLSESYLYARKNLLIM
ncbi:hypothetical protein [Tatumella terrea]|uniref:Uncharacterized protein n=1 Tax=Tatumella terrea TaxID=419007 RepID=A0ABW1VXY3_9GAMM